MNKNIKTKYYYVGKFSENLAKVKNKNGYGFINLDEYEVIKCQYEDASNFCEDLVAVKSKKNHKWGFIDKAGNVMINFIYNSSIIYYF